LLARRLLEGKTPSPRTPAVRPRDVFVPADAGDKAALRRLLSRLEATPTARRIR
jgi:hypothetical protein